MEIYKKYLKESDDFDKKFKSWLNGCQKIVDQNYKTHFPNIPENLRTKLEIQSGQKRYKIVAVAGPSKSAWAFVDKETGDIFKPASWKVPAKHARGNIFDDKNGLGSIGPYGPAYLR